MKKLSANSPCPCQSGLKYKHCCRPYHLGKRAPDALVLMKSRYSAYAAGDARYIIETTHPEHPESTLERKHRKEEILAFCRATEFTGLEILEYLPGKAEAFVTFRAKLGENSLLEKSRFLLFKGRWLYREALGFEEGDPSPSGF